MTWSDKRAWQGQWRNGRMDGIGIFYDQNNRAFEGEWKNGERIRWISGSEDPNVSFTKSMYKGLD
jgi:MORN repeat